jgi:uncharacterized membrane protein
VLFTQEISKFQNSKNDMHQVDRKLNFPENFSFLAFMTTEQVETNFPITATTTAHVTDGKEIIAQVMFYAIISH